MPSPRLEIRDFAQIKKASIQLGDLTVLVGKQATGNSLILQWLKAALDGEYIRNVFSKRGRAAHCEDGC